MPMVVRAVLATDGPCADGARPRRSGGVVNADQKTAMRRCKDSDTRPFETSSTWVADQARRVNLTAYPKETRSVNGRVQSHCLNAQSNRHGGCLAFMNGAEQIARRDAISHQVRFDAGPLQGFAECVVGN